MVANKKVVGKNQKKETTPEKTKRATKYVRETTPNKKKSTQNITQ